MIHTFHPGDRVQMTTEAQRRWGHCYRSTKATVICTYPGHHGTLKLVVRIDGHPHSEEWSADWWHAAYPEATTEELQARAMAALIVRE